jgi:phospholipid-binding lipoprotein MlaA
MYHVNDKLYFWALKPLAQGYSKIVPEDFRIAVSNFFDNVKAPVRFVNNLLQLKFREAAEELARFTVNSTIGVGGLGDPARTERGLKRHDEDLGQTFGRYGIGHGIYLVWPLLGPSSIRDTLGFVGDKFLTPTSYITPTGDSLAVSGVDIINRTSFRIGDYEGIIEAAVDPYVSIRDGYLQHRKKEVAQ